MSGGWSIVAFWLLPPPLVMIGLLVVPLPRRIDRAVNNFLLMVFRTILSAPVLNTLQLVHVMIIITGVTFLGATHDVARYHSKRMPEDPTPGQKINLLAGRWRAERNWWIAFIAALSWLVLLRFCEIKKRLLEADKKCSRLEGEAQQYTNELARLATAQAAAATGASTGSKMQPLEVEASKEPKKDK